MFRSSSDSSSSSSHLSFRRALKAPGRPIAVRTEYIKDSKTLLVVRPQGDRQSSRAYKIEDADGVTLFTATGRKFSVRACREFWDASGLPLFELHRKMSLKNTWSVTLPGSKQANIATASAGWSVGDFKITFQNRAAVESKKEEEKILTLEVEKYGNVLASFDVVDGDRKVAEIRESIPHNERLALLPSSKKGYRPVLDVTVLPGVDLSLIAIITVMASDWVFSSNY